MTDPGDEDRGREGEGGGGSSDEDAPSFVDIQWAITGGVLAALFAFGGMMAVGFVGSGEARHLLEAIVPSVRFLCSAVMTAAATILALMLTLLSFSQAHETDFRESHYQRVSQISGLATASIVAGTFLLLLVTVPLQESAELRRWYDVVYYVVVVASSLLGGMLVAVILMLWNAIRGLIGLLSGVRESHLVARD